MSRLASFARFGRIYRIFKTLKFYSLYEVFLESQLAHHMNVFISKRYGFDRILEMITIFVLMQHVTSCIWIFIGRYNSTSKNNWIYDGGYTDDDVYNLYMTAVYFTVTTVLTVGYGDISANNDGERFFCIFLMVVGVFLFSFATGSLTSMISSMDHDKAQLQEKIAMLDTIQMKYHINPELYKKIS